MAENNSIKNQALAAGVGYTTYKGSKMLCGKAFRPYCKGVFANMRNLSSQNSDALKQAVSDAFENSGLKAKGVVISDIKPEQKGEFTEIFVSKFQKYVSKIIEAMNKKVYGNNIPEAVNAYNAKLIDVLGKYLKNGKSVNRLADVISEGGNAAYHPLFSNIMVNLDKLSSATFHEMGHALNSRSGKLLKTLFWGRHALAYLIPLFFAIGLLKNKKQEGEKPQGVTDKMNTFIKDNAGKLTFAAAIPTLAEEGLASIRGAKLASKVIQDKNLLKKINIANARAWSTYFIGAVLTPMLIRLAINTRDKVASQNS